MATAHDLAARGSDSYRRVMVAGSKVAEGGCEERLAGLVGLGGELLF